MTGSVKNNYRLRLQLILILALILTQAGCKIRLGNPTILWALWVIPLLAVFYIYVFKSKERLMKQFAELQLLSRITSSVNTSRQRLKAGIIIGVVATTLFSLAQPKYGFKWEEIEREGVDIIIALDVSDSMLVEDAETGGTLTRLERAKREIRDLINLLKGDRIGLVAFAGTAFVECPLTLDYAAADLFLSAIDTDIIPIKGTAIGEALDVSLGALKDSKENSRAVILITDGCLLYTSPSPRD